MKDTSLYQQIIGETAPWIVSEVRLNAETLTVDIALTIRSGEAMSCPKCQGGVHLKEWRIRRWRHLDSCQFKTFLEASVPVVECLEHGIQTVQVPWADKSSRFTAIFERFAIKVLESCPTNKAANLLGITWDQADGIKQRAVSRGIARRKVTGVEYLCIDEKSVGHGHDYVTVASGLLANEFQVLYTGDGKDEAALDDFWKWLGPKGCLRIKAVSIDMSQSYQNAVRKHCPDADIIFDPFHIMKMINKALNEVRKAECYSSTKRVMDVLRGTRQLWLYGMENVPDRHAERFDELKNSTMKTARAWRLKELWRTFKQCVDVNDGKDFYTRWHSLAMRSKLEPIKKVARTLKNHLAGIVSFLKYRICNAFAESINSRIQLMIQKSCGYRNRQRLKTDILFHFGGLDLSPVITQ